MSKKLPPVMELAATTKISQARQETMVPQRVENPEDSYPEVIGIRINRALYDQISAMIAGAKLAGDYSHQTVGGFIRDALRAYSQDQFPFTAPAEVGKKMATSVRLTEELKAFYHGLPDRSRSEILERVVRTYLKQGLGL